MITMTMKICMKMVMMKSIYSSTLNTSELIHQIIFLIKHKKDYSRAIEIMNENFITIEILQENYPDLSQSEKENLSKVS